MKKLMVVLVPICFIFGAWQQSGDILLPKTIQVDDLTIDNSGEIWILSSATILKLDATSNNPILIQRVADARMFSVIDGKAYILDNSNRLLIVELDEGDVVQLTNLFFNTPTQLSTAVVDGEATLVVLEPNQLLFAVEENIRGVVVTKADRFSTVPLGDYGDTQTPLFTLVNNQIYSWTGGTVIKANDYRYKLLYSSSGSILDISVDQRGNVYVLFSDSIVVLRDNGEYKSKIAIDFVPSGSRLLVNPARNNLVLFNDMTQALKIISEVGKEEKGDVIVLNKNHPNPVDNYTEIEFTINQPLDLTITVYNLIGEPVKAVARGYYTRGTHRVLWHADDEQGNLVPNGVYFYRLESRRGVAIRQLIVLR
ncbi:MAG: T9SS type A sorting domain-containing protein [candidate division WOR-3 bacterium]|nr:MAG: T9SS type A sorting domain-containing protein [candidate division WOR-3 bacterium]